VAEFFTRPAGAPEGGGGAGSLPPTLPWLLGVLLVAGVGWRVRRARGPRGVVAPESRHYLAMRDAYARAGLDLRRAPTPGALLDALEAARAPGLAEAREVVALYQRARFGGRAVGGTDRARMAAGVAAVRRALREARTRTQPMGAPSRMA
jgi:hypothetical protein